MALQYSGPYSSQRSSLSYKASICSLSSCPGDPLAAPRTCQPYLPPPRPFLLEHCLQNVGGSLHLCPCSNAFPAPCSLCCRRLTSSIAQALCPVASSQEALAGGRRRQGELSCNPGWSSLMLGLGCGWVPAPTPVKQPLSMGFGSSQHGHHGPLPFSTAGGNGWSCVLTVPSP